MKQLMVFTASLACITLCANAAEQILFESNRDENDEIYRHFPGVRTERLTFAEGGDYDPALSPDGTKMAYVSRIGGNLEIAVLDFKSGKRKQLTFSPVPNSYLDPTWSPDGGRIAFSSDRDGDFEIYIMDASGKNVTNMTDNLRRDDVSPHWSPVSQMVVFTSIPVDGEDEVYLLDVKTRTQRKLATASYIEAYPRWSPKGSQIAYFATEWPDFGLALRTPAIWRVKADGTNLEALMTEGEGNRDPKFSPDGKRIAFVSSRNFNRDIYALNLETKELTRLTTHFRIDSDPDWSPDGERIAFVSDRDGSPGLFTMTVNRKQITNLTKSGMAEFNPTWSPDGEKIAFSRRIGDNGSRIYVIDSSGENEVELVDLPLNNFYPEWSPRGDKIAFVNRPERGEPKSRIWTIDPGGQNLQVLYEDPDERIGEIAWSDDGTQIIFSQIHGPFTLLDTATHEVRTIDVPMQSLYSLDWSPNGQAIIFAGLQGVESLEPRRGVFIIDRDGNPVRTILMDTPLSTTDGLAWSPDGNKILFGRDGGLHTLDLDSEATETVHQIRQRSRLARFVSPSISLSAKQD